MPGGEFREDGGKDDGKPEDCWQEDGWQEDGRKPAGGRKTELFFPQVVFRLYFPRISRRFFLDNRRRTE